MNMLIKRCLCHGVKILPFQLHGALSQYNSNQIPDKDLELLGKDDLERYVNGLFYSSLESARDWTKGHNILKSIGFIKVEREEGHRIFTSLKWQKKEVK